MSNKCEFKTVGENLWPKSKPCFYISHQLVIKNGLNCSIAIKAIYDITLISLWQQDVHYGSKNNEML